MSIRTKKNRIFRREPDFYEKISNEFCFPENVEDEYRFATLEVIDLPLIFFSLQYLYRAENKGFGDDLAFSIFRVRQDYHELVYSIHDSYELFIDGTSVIKRTDVQHLTDNDNESRIEFRKTEYEKYLPHIFYIQVYLEEKLKEYKTLSTQKDLKTIDKAIQSKVCLPNE